MRSVQDFPWSAHSKWLDPPDWHEEDGCFKICHEYHKEEGIVEEGCEFCQEKH